VDLRYDYVLKPLALNRDVTLYPKVGEELFSEMAWEIPSAIHGRNSSSGGVLSSPSWKTAASLNMAQILLAAVKFLKFVPVRGGVEYIGSPTS